MQGHSPDHFTSMQRLQMKLSGESPCSQVCSRIRRASGCREAGFDRINTFKSSFGVPKHERHLQFLRELHAREFGALGRVPS